MLNKKFSLLSGLKPTVKAKISSQKISVLGLEISNWDLGGQVSYRKAYLENKEKYFTDIQSIFYVIDIQKPARFEEALTYLKEILKSIVELNPDFKKNSTISILLHKLDPDLKKNQDLVNNANNLEAKIKNLATDMKFSFYRTSIYDESSLLKAFSEGVIYLSHKAQLINTLLKEYMSQSFNSATLLLDQNCFIIASRTTSEQYQEVCESIAPRLTQALEKLEDWNIKTVDIVTNIIFPEKSAGSPEEQREGLIFLRKLDIEKERIYLVSLCLNKKIKSKSYELLPVLATNLKNLIENFQL